MKISAAVTSIGIDRRFITRSAELLRQFCLSVHVRHIRAEVGSLFSENLLYL